MKKSTYSHVEDTTSNIFKDGYLLPSGVAMELLRDYENSIVELENEKEELLMEIQDRNDKLCLLDEKLENVIPHEFRIGQEVFIVTDIVEKATIEKVIATVGKIDEENLISYSVTDENGYARRIPQEQVFANKQIAELYFNSLNRGVK